ncbi:hypothetical protein CLV78_10515 [Aliiruegeria haliotis]|uniref:Uncharacterized protein n=1 Tax=Aliiruegeria haliotis TaxID=1280846 RepID=A0A2T0RPE3_9RHOB|nr:hypothetical protein [Aliiruegeria haliotis]PRY22963.1 hypothetical protein CLV78_10515 [Aliiruegeria haliotis]
MLKRIFTHRRDPLRRALDEEIASLCRDQQMRGLSLSGHLRKDVGLDCGCTYGPDPWQLR